ncbi:MAG: TIGR04282 family arsenosugar biosynthesis glycosyltransferase [Blastocatellia bacterium]|nr:TIGR04282 family arsenosugar biosynthesis glycosyltransferase [Blastocatellia bacterium]
MRDRLIVFTRYPESGRTKTRLIPALGPGGAARLHREMAEHTFAVVKQFGKRHRVSVVAYYTGGSKEMMKQWLGSAVTLRQQGDGDLGARISRAFREALRSGMNRVIIIGTDSPRLSVQILQKALDALTSNDVVIGPAKDGGYYLIGLRREIPELFKDIPWGTSHVLEITLEIAHRIGICPVLLETLEDVDRPEDLYLLEQT